LARVQVQESVSEPEEVRGLKKAGLAQD